MASALAKHRDYKHIAEKYSEINEPQVECGKRFLTLLDLKGGEKILDMGCGTGDLTAFMAYQVGAEGHVVGVDPDKERIEVAVQNYSHIKRNLSFTLGQSSSQFPHFNQEYYDLHFSNFVFQWLTSQEKKAFVKTAFKSLKPGGLMAIQSLEKNPEIITEASQLLPDNEIERNKPPVQFVKKSVTESLLKKAGFVILSSEYVVTTDSFSTLDDFLTWYCVSDYFDASNVLPEKRKAFATKFVNKDGTVTLLAPTIYQIIAKKGKNYPF